MSRQRNRFALGCALLFSTASALRAQASEGASASVREAAVDRLASLLREKYVFAEKGAKAAETILAKKESGAYSRERSDSDFSQALTRDMQGVAGDRHLVVQWISAEPPADDEDRERRDRENQRRNNFGFETAGRLEGNVGYVDLRSFDDPGMGGDTAVAAMNLVANCDALIFDLRNNGGGDGAMIGFLASYLFETRTHLNDRESRGEGGSANIEQFWTNEVVRGKKLTRTPVFVLTSRRTFSAAEEFAYDLQALKRATIVGERTGGGANPGDFFPIGGPFRVFVPTARSVNPVTKTNWEGSGVAPDVASPEASARDVAYGRALAALSASASDPRQKAQLDWARTSVEARLHPATLSAEQADRYVGSYGPRTVRREGNTLSIRYRDLAPTRLVPLAGSTFGLEGEETFRLRFEIGSSGRATRLIGLTEDGIAYESDRKGD